LFTRIKTTTQRQAFKMLTIPMSGTDETLCHQRTARGGIITAKQEASSVAVDKASVTISDLVLGDNEIRYDKPQ
jgi:hypothetical protein